MNQTMTLIAKNFVNLIYPLHCAACGVPLDAMDTGGLCLSCESRIKQNAKPFCIVCGRPVKEDEKLCAECEKQDLAFDRAWSACLYEGVLKEVIHLFKYGGKLALSGTLAGQMTGFVRDNPEIIDGIGLLTFVPMRKKGSRQRSFNQSEILASAIAKEFGIPVSQVLDKVIPTRRQNELSRDERLFNLMGAFRVKSGITLDAVKILLVDDVMTTGTTLSECAKVLKASAAAEVRCLTLARGL
ncbi:MAG: ComF family protein [Candidatus Omnitrophica bacterium]|nr:ComF family protein [Candidatus Omnitrophota bacterium]